MLNFNCHIYIVVKIYTVKFFSVDAAIMTDTPTPKMWKVWCGDTKKSVVATTFEELTDKGITFYTVKIFLGRE